MRTMTIASAVLLGAGALLLAGCAGSPGGSANPSEVPSDSGESAGPTLVAQWETPEADEPRLALFDDGTFSAHDGCNPFKGTYTRADDTLTFHVTYGTQKGCLNIDPWLNAIDTASVSDTVVHVFNASGTEIGTLDVTR